MSYLILLPAILLPLQDRAGAMAEVNGEVITRWDLEKALGGYPPYRELKRSYEGEAFRRQARPYELEVLDILIQQKLLEQEIKKRKITLDRPDRAEVERQHKISIARYGNEETYRLALENSGMTVEDDLEQIRLRVLLDKLIREEFGPEPFVSPREIREAYQGLEEEVERTGGLEGEMGSLCLKGTVRVRQIRLAGDARKKADEIRARAVAGEDFAELARTHSEGPRKKDGGLWTFEGQEAPFTEKRAAAVRALGAGEVSEVIPDRQHLYILKLEERSAPGLRPFEEVRGRIHRALAAKKRVDQQARWFQKLVRNAHIVNYLEQD